MTITTTAHQPWCSQHIAPDSPDVAGVDQCVSEPLGPQAGPSGWLIADRGEPTRVVVDLPAAGVLSLADAGTLSGALQQLLATAGRAPQDPSLAEAAPDLAATALPCPAWCERRAESHAFDEVLGGETSRSHHAVLDRFPLLGGGEVSVAVDQYERAILGDAPVHELLEPEVVVNVPTGRALTAAEARRVSRAVLRAAATVERAGGQA
ncbi:hypothetical protein CLV35_1294 [Motilibacter peucedani]|uniref:Uncharacterized protein n=1 Tax=Motilibacter peucedani TaxID=598650 RepID=A0A420XS02_9ACTN|nr:hypothetical protein [Motilibacter peucedani]RKS77600.1 hypothetical protein CLV35_1294 [Motilibacter peucedani]